MKGSNLFYGIALLLLTYLLTIPSFNITIPYVGINVPIPNPLYSLGQLTFFKVPLWVMMGLFAVICVLTAFQSDEQTVVFKEK
jgi:hypothetical protein